MTPYLRAHAAYHRHGPPGIPWLDAVDFHLQCGLFISDSRIFLMARPVPDLTDDEQLSLTSSGASTLAQTDWHVWSAAGDLFRMIPILEDCSPLSVSFQRRGGRLKTYFAHRFAHLLELHDRLIPF